MEKNWFKISEKQPTFDKPVIVKTVQSVYAIAELVKMQVSKSGINYYWYANQFDMEDFEGNEGEIVEWCEIPQYSNQTKTGGYGSGPEMVNYGEDFQN